MARGVQEDGTAAVQGGAGQPMRAPTSGRGLEVGAAVGTMLQ